MKLSIVVIWYNPDEQTRQNLLGYADSAEKTYIIDNSSQDNSNLAEGIPNVVYVANNDNLGIAKAQNIGCEMALKDGFEWCMTMDQDSQWEPSMLSEFLTFVEHDIPAGNHFSYGPDATDEKTTFLLKKTVQFIKKICGKGQKPDIQTVDALIASGNIINLTKWQEVGGFNESYFIDSVDHEFCLKLNERFPGCIIQNNRIKLIHSLGDAHFSLLTRFDFHHGVRLYYMVRNVLYLRERFPAFVKQNHIIRRYIFLFLQNIRDFRYSDASWMIKGYKAYKNKEIGKYVS